LFYGVRKDFPAKDFVIMNAVWEKHIKIVRAVECR